MALLNYREMQKVSRYLSEEIPRIYGIDCFPEIARLLGIKHGGNVVLESEEEINFMIDFYLNEYDYQGQNFYEQYREEHPNIDERQVAYLDAAQQSYTSFFEIVDIQVGRDILVAKDLLNSSELHEITNRGLSLTGQIGYIIFSRFLSFSDFNSFSGMYALFPNSCNIIKRQKVMKKRVKSNKDSIQRFVAAFKLNRKFGIEIHTSR